MPEICVVLRLRTWSSGKAIGAAQLLGKEPVMLPSGPVKFMICRAGKLPLSAQESGKSGRLPVKVRLTRDCRHPRACHVLAEKLDGHSATTEYPDAL